MVDSTPSDGTIRIDRFRVQYHLPSQHPAPQRLRSRLDRVTAGVPDGLSAVLRRSLPDNDNRVCLIRRVSIDLALNLDGDEDRLERAWAVAIARELTDTMHSGRDGENVRWYASPTDYLARFLIELAAGNAWNRWYFTRFEGLKLLPASAALRTAICDDAACGQAALQSMNNADALSVLRSLSPPDAARVLDELSVSNGDAGTKSDPALSLKAIAAAFDSHALQLSEDVRALYLFLRGMEHDPQPGRQSLRSAAIAVSHLAQQKLDPDTDRLMRALRGRDASAVLRIIGPASAQKLEPLLRVPSTLFQSIARMMTDGRQPSVADGSVEATARDTFFGGAFLLLPVLATLPSPSITETWSNVDETGAANLLRFLVLARCFGGHSLQAIYSDPLLRDLMCIAPQISRRQLDDWQQSCSDAVDASFSASIARWQRESGAAAGEQLLLSPVTIGDRQAHVLLDAKSGTWLHVDIAPTTGGNSITNGLLAAIAMWRELTSAPPTIIAPADIAADLRGQADVRVVVLGADSQDDRTVEAVRRLQHLADDADYLLGRESVFTPLSTTLAVCAQTVLRLLARRLPGFAEASLPWMFANFLDVGASLEDEPDRRIVRVSNPPLSVVLRMTGMLRSSYICPWLDVRPFCLFPAE